MEDLVLVLSVVASSTSGNCDSGSMLAELILVAALYFIKNLLVISHFVYFIIFLISILCKLSQCYHTIVVCIGRGLTTRICGLDLEVICP